MSSNLPPSLDPDKKNDNETKNKFENFFAEATANTRDIVAYILLVLGIILLFVEHIYGGLLIGVVLGVYFAKEVIEFINNIELFIEKQGLARSLILGGGLLALLISVPAIFVGAAVVVVLRMFIFPDKADV